MKATVLKLLAAANLLVMLGGTALAQPLTFDRATTCASGDGYGGWGPSKLVVDAQGNTYVVGTFNGTIVLGNALLSATQTPPNRLFPSDVFVAKLDPAGNYLWAVQLGDNQSATVGGLAVDAAGDVYLTGSFTSYSLRVGAGGPQLFNSSARGEGFVAKLSGTTGYTFWARRIGGTGDDGLGSLAVNQAGDLYVLGSSGSLVADVGPFTLTNPQGFLAKLSPGGTWLWVRPVGNANASATHLLLDAQGGLYLAGRFQAPSVSFGSITLTTQGVPGSPYPTTGSELFVAKTDDAGNWLWAVQGDALTHLNLIDLLAAGLDGAGHLYVAGSYTSTAARIGTTVLPNLSNQYPQPTPAPPVPYTNNYFTDAFVARLNSATGVWDWAVRNGGPYFENAGTLVVDANGALYVLGTFNSATLVGTGQQLAQLNASTGAWGPMYSLAPVFARDMALDGQHRLNLGGTFSSATATLGAFTLAQNGSGQATGFLARIAALPLAGRATSQRPTRMEVWPNPVAGSPVQVQGPTAGQVVQVFDVLGRLVAGERMPATGPLRWSLTLPTGVYVVRAGSQARRLVVE